MNKGTTQNHTTLNFVREVFVATIPAVIFAWFSVQVIPIVHHAENWTGDVRVALLSPSLKQSQNIAIVALDETTLASFPYHSPVDRSFLADLIHSLRARKVRAIGLDIIFDQPTEAEKDAELREKLREDGVLVAITNTGGANAPQGQQTAFLTEFLDGIESGTPVIFEDSDGVVREIPLRHDGLPSFVATIARTLGVPVSDTPSLLIDWRPGPQPGISAFPIYPAHALDAIPDEWLAGRIVLVGVVLAGADRHQTPFTIADPERTLTPGVLIHAHALSQITEGRPERRAGIAVIMAAFLIGGLLGALAGNAGRSIVVRVCGPAIATTAIWVAGFSIYRAGGPIIPIIGPMLALMVAATIVLVRSWRHEARTQRFIRDAFSRYVAPTVVEALVRDPTKLRLGGERRVVTFLFTDLEGFTSFVESAEVTTFVEVINTYLDATCRIVHNHEGTIEKIVGDALHVMFNAPLDQPDHAERAVKCALALDEFCTGFVAHQQSLGVRIGHTRIGINTGKVVVGNFGGSIRFDYTANGDVINTAARLEGANKVTGTRICVSNTTAEHCIHQRFRPIGGLLLKGKTKPVYTLEPIPDNPDGLAPLDEYHAAYSRLEAGDPSAAGAFLRLSKHYPRDRLVSMHTRRLASEQTGKMIVLTEK